MENKKSSDLDFIEEDNKTSIQFTRYSLPSVLHVNPLITNKGAPKKDILSILKCKSKKFTEAYEMQKSIKSPISIIDDAHDMKEFNLASRDTNINRMLKVPAFDLHPAIELTIPAEEHEAGLTIQDDLTVNLNKDITPYKSVSMIPQKHNGIESFAENLSPQECEFLKEVYSCKFSYFSHALKIPDISFQYATIMDEVCRFSDSDLILKQIERLLKLIPDYSKGSEYKSII